MKRIITIFLVLYSIPVWSYLFSSDYSLALNKVVIDPGHGGKDPGNLGTGRYQSQEKDIALDVSLKLGAYIKENMPDVEVVFTRVIKMFFLSFMRELLLQIEKKQICLFPSIVMLLAILRHMDVLLLLLE